MSIGRSLSRREFLQWVGLTVGSAAFSACAMPAVTPVAVSPTATPTTAPEVTLRVMGFEVPPEERGLPLDLAYKKFLADFQTAHPNIKIESLETPPDADTQLLVDLAAGTAPDVWQADASTLARLIDSGYVLDMRKVLELVPELNLDRFFPTVLEIHKRPDGALYGLPNDFTPMVIFYNPLSYQRANVPLPTSDWTWDDLLEKAQLLTLDSSGRNRLDPNFDEANVVQWGFRVRKWTFEWVYRTWQNGSDVLSPDGTTASGYLDSPESIEAIQFLADMVLKHKVAPTPSALDQMIQSLGFLNRFLKGEFANFDRGHWELVGLRGNPEYKPEAVAVVRQPKKKSHATVIYESSWVINGAVEGDNDKLKATGLFVEATTSRQYQDTKAITGIAIAANKESAEIAAEKAPNPEIERVFLEAVADGRAPYGALYAKWPAIETILDSMMERVLAGNAIKDEVLAAVTEINRELGQK
jgi:multiple sugar transport system substrate-binding protein